MGIRSSALHARFTIACVLLLVGVRFSTVAAAADKLRLVIETDAPGGDPDDEGSLVRFFLYLNEWDVEGDRTQDALARQAPAGGRLTLDAAGTTDPDGDKLRYEWFVYPEPGTYGGPVTLAGADTPKCTLHIPPDAAGKTIHVILQVTQVD